MPVLQGSLAYQPGRVAGTQGSLFLVCETYGSNIDREAVMAVELFSEQGSKRGGDTQRYSLSLGVITDEYGRRRESFADLKWSPWSVETHMLWSVDGLVKRLPTEERTKGKWVKPTKTTPGWVSEEWANTYHFDYRDAELQIARAAAALDDVEAPTPDSEAVDPHQSNLGGIEADSSNVHAHPPGVAVAEEVSVDEGSISRIVPSGWLRGLPAAGGQHHEAQRRWSSRLSSRTGLEMRLQTISFL